MSYPNGDFGFRISIDFHSFPFHLSGQLTSPLVQHWEGPENAFCFCILLQLAFIVVLTPNSSPLPSPPVPPILFSWFVCFLQGHLQTAFMAWGGLHTSPVRWRTTKPLYSFLDQCPQPTVVSSVVLTSRTAFSWSCVGEEGRIAFEERCLIGSSWLPF